VDISKVIRLKGAAISKVAQKGQLLYIKGGVDGETKKGNSGAATKTIKGGW
jgi:hypothetical protein